LIFIEKHKENQHFPSEKYQKTLIFIEKHKENQLFEHFPEGSFLKKTTKNNEKLDFRI